MNSAAVVNETPEQVISYTDYWKQNNSYGTLSNPDQMMVKFLNLFTGEDKRVKADYEAYLNNVNNRNEAKAVQSARAYDEYMANTVYSRAFKDLEKAGVNPYLILNSGSSPSTSAGSASKASYSAKSMQDTASNTKGRDLALVMLAIARLVAAL